MSSAAVLSPEAGSTTDQLQEQLDKEEKVSTSPFNEQGVSMSESGSQEPNQLAADCSEGSGQEEDSAGSASPEVPKEELSTSPTHNRKPSRSTSSPRRSTSKPKSRKKQSRFVSVCAWIHCISLPFF